MAVNVNEFIEQLDERKGKLERWESDIFALYHANASYEYIATYLRLNGVPAIRMEVYRFIHRKKRKHLHQSSTPETAPPGEIPSQPAAHPENPVSSTSEKQQQETTLPKFSWRQSRTKDEPKW